MTVFSVMIVMMLSMSNSLIGHASRIDENTEIERDVRVFFDLLRRDLAQCRIGLNQNTFRGETNRLIFASSTPRLKTDHVSDVRLIVYQLDGDKVLRSVVEPTMSNFTAGSWNPYTSTWWNNAALTNTAFTEVILEGIIPYTSQGQTYPLFTYVSRSTGSVLPAPTTTTNPPAGVMVSFGILGKSARQKDATGLVATKDFRYDIEMNLPPIFDP